MSTTLNALQKQRRDTAANWTTANPTLLAGEIGIESDTSKIKIGDGSTAWNSLGYTPWSQVSAYPIVNADVASNAEIAVSKLADGTARQLLQTDAAGTGVEWTSNVDVPGTLDVTGAATFDNNVTIQGDLTVNGTTTTIDTTNLAIEDKNIEIGKVATPTDVTADGGGITLKGTTDKTINWVDATDAWTLSEHVSIASGKEYRINGTKVLDATSLGSGVLITSSNITDGTIVNADINASAAIAGTKISPDFGSQNTTTTGTVTGASLIPSSSTAPSNGVYLPAANTVGISTASTERIRIGSAGQIGIGGANYGTSGQVLTSNGSGAAPSWQSSVSQWTTSGSNIYYSTGSVGIGTTNPSYLLTASASSTSTTLNDSAHWTAAVQNTGAATANQLNSLLFRFADGTYNGNSVISALRESGTGRQQSLIFAPSNSSGDPTERARIDSSGRVGVGTSSPGAALHVVTSGAGQIRYGDGTVTGAFGSHGLGDSVFVGSGAGLRFTTNGLGSSDTKMFIDTSGRVGIGTSSPAARLHVSSSGTGTSAGSNIVISARSEASGRDAAIQFADGTTSAYVGMLSGAIYFADSGSTERVRIDSSGRVGIGTATPGSYSSSFDDLVIANAADGGITIVSSNTSSGTIAFADGTTGSEQYRGFIQYGHASDALLIGTGGAERARIDSSGRWLLGTSSAPVDGKLFVQGNSFSATEGGVLHLMRGEAATTITAGEEIGKIAFSDNAGKDFATITTLADAAAGTNDFPGRLVFSVTADGASSPTEAMRISNNRNVRFGTSGTSYGMFDINNDGSSTYKLEYTNVSSTRVFGVTSGGIVESKGSYDSVTVSAANAFLNATTYQLQRSTSSIKYKKDVETIEDRYSDALLQCRPVWYRSKCENDNPAWGHWGFIAEEVAEIDPRLCHYGKDENGADVIESVQYDRFVPHLLNLIKRQQQAIEALEARISALEAQ